MESESGTKSEPRPNSTPKTAILAVSVLYHVKPDAIRDVYVTLGMRFHKVSGRDDQRE